MSSLFGRHSEFLFPEPGPLGPCRMWPTCLRLTLSSRLAKEFREGERGESPKSRRAIVVRSAGNFTGPTGDISASPLHTKELEQSAITVSTGAIDILDAAAMQHWHIVRLRKKR